MNSATGFVLGAGVVALGWAIGYLSAPLPTAQTAEGGVASIRPQGLDIAQTEPLKIIISAKRMDLWFGKVNCASVGFFDGSDYPVGSLETSRGYHLKATSFHFNGKSVFASGCMVGPAQ